MPPNKKEVHPQFSEDNPQVVSSRNIAIPLWQVWSIAAGCVAFTIYAMTLLNTINGKVDRAMSNRWGKNEQRQFAQELDKMNGGKVTVPDVDAVWLRFQN